MVPTCPTKWHPKTFDGVSWSVQQLCDMTLDPRTVTVNVRGFMLPEVWQRTQDMYRWYAKGRIPDWRGSQENVYELYKALQVLTDVRNVTAAKRRAAKLEKDKARKAAYKQQ